MNAPATNRQEYTVSELSNSLKRTVEQAYDDVTVRGELGRVTLARSGHLYIDIKDDKSVLNTIMWKGQASKLGFKPEEGMEVVASGKLSTYASRSNYQLLAHSLKPAGEGALMAVLEKRRKQLAAEGLFDERHKQELPFLPKVVGVVTSPTGAVFRDILHRIGERFPVTVVLWPALVQGELAEAQIEAGIRGFNAMQGPMRPDVLIVGRGGGSVEDLWPFNEESVVRAAFDSRIPLISAVGHETDTTLIDFVSDRRAPTPTGAAEFAVPVREQLGALVGEQQARLGASLQRTARRGGDRLHGARLPRLAALVQGPRQRLGLAAQALSAEAARDSRKRRDQLTELGERLPSLEAMVEKRRSRFNEVGPLPPPRYALLRPVQAFSEEARALRAAAASAAKQKRSDLAATGARLAPGPVIRQKRSAQRDLALASGRLEPAAQRQLAAQQAAVEELRVDLYRGSAALKASAAARLGRADGLLEALSFRSVLSRGFALVRTPGGKLVRSAADAGKRSSLSLSFEDGDVTVRKPPRGPAAASPGPDTGPGGGGQGRLL